jgi:hypothetical protein
VPEKVEQEITERKPFQISLTGIQVEDAVLIEADTPESDAKE